MKNHIKYLKHIHVVVHSNSQGTLPLPLILIILFLEACQKAYLLSWEIYDTIDNMIVIEKMISYTFAIDILSQLQREIAIALCLVFQIAFVVLFILIRNGILIMIIQTIFLSFNRILFIPILYLNFNQFYDQNNDMKAFYDTLAALNLIICVFIVFVATYFIRQDILVDTNALRTIPTSLVIQMIQHCLIITAIVLRVEQELQSFRVGLLIIHWSLQWMNDLYGIGLIHQYNSYLLLFSFSLGTNIFLNYGLLNTLIIFSLGLGVNEMLVARIKTNVITRERQDSVSLCQALYDLIQNEMESKEARLLLQVAFKQHSACKKCREPQQMIGCILNKLVRKPNAKSHIILFYSNYVANTAPVRSLIGLLDKQRNNSLYNGCAYYNLQLVLHTKIQQFQNYKQVDESKLDLSSIYQASLSSEVLFPQFLRTINQKISFWNAIIRGFGNMYQYQTQSLLMTNQMLTCKKLVEKRFDVTQGKLKDGKVCDILTLRILQLYFTAVYSNYILAVKQEKEIEEIMNNERFLREEDQLNNIALVQSRTIILKSSLTHHRGELLQLNKKQLQQFMNCQQDDIRHVKYIHDILPPFLGQVHQKLIEHYISKGSSSLFRKGQTAFYQNIRGFLEPCVIHLCNLFDTMDDFILNMILAKDSQSKDYILFAADGKILGVTEKLQSQLNQNQINISSHLNMEQIIRKGGLIQFYMPQLVNSIETLRKQIIDSQDNYLINQRGVWVVPSNHEECLNEADHFLEKYKRKELSEKSFHNEFSRISRNTNLNLTLCYNEDYFDEEEKQKIIVNDIVLLILHEELNQTIGRAVKMDQINKETKILLFNMEFKQLVFKGGKIGYFVLSVNEVKQLKRDTQSNFTSKFGLTLNHSPRESSNLDISEENKSNMHETSRVPPTESEAQIAIREMNQLNHMRYMDSFSDQELVEQASQNPRQNVQLEQSKRYQLSLNLPFLNY